MDNSALHVTGNRIDAYVGKDATSLFRAKAIKAALEMFNRTGMKANRLYTPSNMCAVAKEYTGKTYKARSKASREQAVSDLEIWINTMTAALPVVERKGPSNG